MPLAATTATVPHPHRYLCVGPPLAVHSHPWDTIGNREMMIRSYGTFSEDFFGNDVAWIIASLLLQFLIFNFSCEFSIFIEAQWATSGTRPEFVTVTDFTRSLRMAVHKNKGASNNRQFQGLIEPLMV